LVQSAAHHKETTPVYALGIDVGGTKIDAVLIDGDARIHAEAVLPTGALDGTDAVIDRIAQLIWQLLREAGDRRVIGIGIGTPGQVDAQLGVARAAINLGWADVPVLAKVRERLPDLPPLALANDVNALALGEYRFGAAQGARNLVYLALGTGLGGASIVEGRVTEGANGFAMEVGHMALNPNGRECVCGLRGCPEIYASGVGLMAGVDEYIRDYPETVLRSQATVSTPAILNAARDGDPLAMRLFNEAAEMLGQVMVVCAATLNPDVFAIGGGLGKAAADLLLPVAETYFATHLLYPAVERTRIVTASVERASIGAASLVMGG